MKTIPYDISLTSQDDNSFGILFFFFFLKFVFFYSHIGLRIRLHILKAELQMCNYLGVNHHFNNY